MLQSRIARLGMGAIVAWWLVLLYVFLTIDDNQTWPAILFGVVICLFLFVAEKRSAWLMTGCIVYGIIGANVPMKVWESDAALVLLTLLVVVTEYGARRGRTVVGRS